MNRAPVDQYLASKLPEVLGKLCCMETLTWMMKSLTKVVSFFTVRGDRFDSPYNVLRGTEHSLMLTDLFIGTAPNIPHLLNYVTTMLNAIDEHGLAWLEMLCNA